MQAKKIIQNSRRRRLFLLIQQSTPKGSHMRWMNNNNPTLFSPYTAPRASHIAPTRARTSHERTSSHSHARQRPLTRTVARHSTRVTIGFQPTGEQTRAMPFSPILGANRANMPRECACDETPVIKRRVARPRRQCLGAWGVGIERCRRTMTRRADD